MIEVYKIPHGVYEEWVTYELVNEMDRAWARGHPMKTDQTQKIKKTQQFLYFKSGECLEFVNEESSICLEG